MPDIFLFQGQANPNDIKLRDPRFPDVANTVFGDLESTEAADVAAVIGKRIIVGAWSSNDTQDLIGGYVRVGYVATGYLPAGDPFDAQRVSVGALTATETRDAAQFIFASLHKGTLAAAETPDSAGYYVAPGYVLAGYIEGAPFTAQRVSVGNYAASEAGDVAAFDATIFSQTPDDEGTQLQPAGRPARDVRRRRYIMPDGRVFLATTQEVIALLQLYAVPKEAIAQLTAPPTKAITVRAPQITLQKRDVRFVPSEQPDTYMAVISERFVYRAPPEVSRHAEISANRMRADEEAIFALLM